MNPLDPNQQLGSKPDEIMNEGFGAVAVTFVIAALLMACAVIWSFV